MMINCDYLSKKEERLLHTALLKRLNNVYVHTLEYSDGLEICAFIKIEFEGSFSLIATTGKYADNIVLLDESEFLKQKVKYIEQDSVRMKENVISIFARLIGEKLLNVECIQKPEEEYYWQFKFVFGKGIFQIDALIDELDFSVFS